MKRFGWICISLMIGFCLSIPFSHAGEKEFNLPSIFGHHMVLQQRMPVPIWGWADPGETIEVNFCGEKKSTHANSKGEWKIILSSKEAGGPFELEIKGKSSTETFRDVMVGEVWLCSGQSNMELPVGGALNSTDEMASAHHPNIRLFNVGKKMAEHPEKNVDGYWIECTPGSVRRFSAVGYFFGRELQSKLNVPIGLIQSTWGGTPIEAWVDRSVLESEPEFQETFNNWDKPYPVYGEMMKTYQDYLRQWQHSIRVAQEKDWLFPPSPGLYLPGDIAKVRPCGLFHGMISPLIPYGIRGVIWYQGEHNISRAGKYSEYFRKMIQGWRREWGQGDFPFLFAQISSYGPKTSDPNVSSPSAELREAQSKVLSITNTAMVVTIDIGDEKDPHPRNKQAVGHRLALASQALVYGNNLVHSGPLFDSLTIEGDLVRLHFKYSESGLVAKNGKLCGFALAGDDHHYFWLDANIKGNTVLLRSHKVPNPKTVRYGWAENPDCNLFNAEGLPASPFRTR